MNTSYSFGGGHDGSEMFKVAPIVYGSSSSSDLSLLSSSSQPSASRPSDLMPKLKRNPTNAMPPKTPKTNASPLGLILVAKEKSPPDKNGPAARPAADKV